MIYLNVHNERIKRTPEEYPYSFDTYCIYYGDYCESDEKAYSDKLEEQDRELFRECYKVMWNSSEYGNTFYPYSHPIVYSRHVEEFLQLYFKNPKIELTAVEVGCNCASGYPYWIFHYRDHRPFRKAVYC